MPQVALVEYAQAMLAAQPMDDGCRGARGMTPTEAGEAGARSRGPSNPRVHEQVHEQVPDGIDGPTS